MYIVTSGKKFLDIDAFAGCIAYAELLNVQGIKAQAISTATINESVTETARSLGHSLSTNYVADENDEFIIIDVSEPDFLDGIVQQDKIVGVIDHHLGYEHFWQDKLADIDIELIGAACTQVYERWVKLGLIEKISRGSARLLSMGILDNTLNFAAEVSTIRDKVAYDKLIKIGGVPDGWAESYFRDCENAITADIPRSLENDTKSMKFPGYNSELKVGQLVVWDASPILDNVTELLGQRGHFINLVSINEGRSYLLSNDDNVRSFLMDSLNVVFRDSMAITERLWLRKEIMKAAIDNSTGDGERL